MPENQNQKRNTNQKKRSAPPIIVPERGSKSSSRGVARERERKAREAQTRAEQIRAERKAQAERDRQPGGRGRKTPAQRSYSHLRRLQSRILYTAVFVAVIGIVAALMFTVFFKIKYIEVIIEEGTLPYTAEDILAHCGISAGDNLLVAPVDRVGKEIETALPYIEKCVIERDYPSAIIIKPVPAEIMGYIMIDEATCVVLSSGGRAVETAPLEAMGDMCRILGVEIESNITVGKEVTTKKPDQLKAAGEITKILAGYGQKANSIRFEDNEVYFVVFNHRITCRVGVPTNLWLKVSLMGAMMQRGDISPYESGTVDLRVVGRATVHPSYLD